ncbi:MAG: prefoldin subunit beta [Nitrososphaeria archaeon]|nr:prefoldin subunit beta [Nitrososphaeria archaeon]
MSFKISPQLQQHLRQLESLQNTYTAVVAQRQSLEAQLIEVKNALAELEKTDENAEVYKMAGSLLIKAEKEGVNQELDESKTLLEARLKTLEKQEKRMSEEIGKLNTVISQMLQREKIGSS